jgi:hypothetical protein
MTKKNMPKKKLQNIMVFEKNAKENFFRTTGLPVKPEYPESRETHETFSPDSFHYFF